MASFRVTAVTVGRDAGSLRRPGSLSLRGEGSSVAAEGGVGRGVAVAEDLEEVDEVGLLGGGQAEVAHLAVLCGHPGGRLDCRLGRRSAGDLLHVVQDLGRREERRVAGRRSLAGAARCSAAAWARGPSRRSAPSRGWGTGGSRRRGPPGERGEVAFVRGPARAVIVAIALTRPRRARRRPSGMRRRPGVSPRNPGSGQTAAAVGVRTTPGEPCRASVSLASHPRPTSLLLRIPELCR